MRSTESVKRTSRSGPRDPAVLDEERAVAGHAGQQRLLLVDGVDVPEARHVEAALDRRGELGLVGRAAAERARGSSGSGPQAEPPGRDARGRSSARRRRRARPSACRGRRAWATPSWISGSGAFGHALGVEARAAACAAKRGESLRLIAGAATRVPRRPTSAPRPSAWARPLKARPAEEVEQLADGVGLEDDRVLARRRASAGSSRGDLAAGALRRSRPASMRAAATAGRGAPSRVRPPRRGR